ncbi:MAG: hypothetical protein MZW92_23090 [Comamonadaceae bacterium]|nr:hypothetical protein [Comamonadaceae bacterium]
MISQTSGHGDFAPAARDARAASSATVIGGRACSAARLHRRRPRRGADRNAREPARSARRQIKLHGRRRRGLGLRPAGRDAVHASTK